MKAPALELRDFSKGRITKYSANAFLIPKNSVSGCLNVNYDTVIGSGTVRPGTTILGTTVASGKAPLGLAEFVGPGGSPNLQIAAFAGASTASLYYYDTSWHTSGLTTLSNTAKNRFSVLGGRIFQANGTDAMKSSADGSTWATTDCITTDSVIPSLLFRAKGRMLASGYSGFRDRVYFSSVIDPNSTPFITWNTNPASGDWIDINPDDGSNVTGFAETSAVTLVFKGKGMYRLDVINKTVDTQNIFNIGAVSQESIVQCQGVVYFFSGQDVRRTNGNFPEQISRLAVQDFIDAIPQANWSSVSAGTDGLNVFFSIGTVTLNSNQDDQRTYSNVTLKFSTRDETWSVHSYAQQTGFYSQFTTSSDGRKMISADTSGAVQTIDKGTTDNGTPIYYEQETQEIEFGNRSHVDSFNNLITFFMKNGIDTTIQIKSNDQGYQDVPFSVPNRVNTSDGLLFKGNFFTFKWFGESTGTPPVIEGMYIEDITDEGLEVSS